MSIGHEESSLYPGTTYLDLKRDDWSARLCVLRKQATSSPARMNFLLVHGNPSHLDDWLHTVPALQGLGNVVAYDQVGFGRSHRLSGREPTLDACAEVALKLADELAWDRFVLVGHSHGAMVAHTLAARAPDRVQALVLLGSGGVPAHGSYRLLGAPFVRPSVRLVGKPLFQQKALRPLAAWATDLALRRSYEPDAIPEGLLEAQLQAFARRPDVLDAMVAVAQHAPCEQVARQGTAVRAPVLFVHGRGDQLVPIAHARRLFELTAKHGHAAFVDMDGGHMQHYCRAHEVNRVLVEWLRSCA